MIPKAKKNLHECEYHLQKMVDSRNVEELEINFAAFVNSARNITFVLQKEFTDNSIFTEWYKVKRIEMDGDPLCKFFKILRNNIVKEGINNLNFNTRVKSLNTATDMIDKPPNSDILIGHRGISYLINKGTPQEDIIPASSKGQILTEVFVENAPKYHLDQEIKENNIINISNIYYSYLKKIVEEFTGIINKK